MYADNMYLTFTRIVDEIRKSVRTRYTVQQVTRKYIRLLCWLYSTSYPMIWPLDSVAHMVVLYNQHGYTMQHK